MVFFQTPSLAINLVFNRYHKWFHTKMHATEPYFLSFFFRQAEIAAEHSLLNTDKTELVWIGSRYSLASLEGCGPSLQLGADVIKPSDQVRLLGVTVAADLSLDGHASSVCKTCFFWLLQLRRVRRSLDADSLKTLVHAFVTSRVDYCNSVLASAPKTVTEKLQRVQNAATSQ